MQFNKMKAKIDENGKVVWVGKGEGDDWVTLPKNLPDQTEKNTTLHYDRETDTWGYKSA